MSKYDGLQLRPRFRFDSTLLPDVMIAKLRKQLEENTDTVTGIIIEDHHVILKIPKENRHYWSPQMDVRLEEVVGKGTILQGMVGPSPQVWTKFMFLYGLVGFIGMVGLVIGMSQWTVGKTPAAMWIVVLCVAAVVAIYMAARAGKKLARDETRTLYYFLLDACEIDPE